MAQEVRCGFGMGPEVVQRGPLPPQRPLGQQELAQTQKRVRERWRVWEWQAVITNATAVRFRDGSPGEKTMNYPIQLGLIFDGYVWNVCFSENAVLPNHHSLKRHRARSVPQPLLSDKSCLGPIAGQRSESLKLISHYNTLICGIGVQISHHAALTLHWYIYPTVNICPTFVQKMHFYHSIQSWEQISTVASRQDEEETGGLCVCFLRRSHLDHSHTAGQIHRHYCVFL